MKPPLKEFSRTVRWPSKHIVQGMAVVRSTRPRSLACIRRNSLGSESGCCSLDSFVEKPRSNYEKSNNRNGVDESTPNELNNPLNNATRAGIRNRSCERKKKHLFFSKTIRGVSLCLPILLRRAFEFSDLALFRAYDITSEWCAIRSQAVSDDIDILDVHMKKMNYLLQSASTFFKGDLKGWTRRLTFLFQFFSTLDFFVFLQGSLKFTFLIQDSFAPKNVPSSPSSSIRETTKVGRRRGKKQKQHVTLVANRISVTDRTTAWQQRQLARGLRTVWFYSNRYRFQDFLLLAELNS